MCCTAKADPCFASSSASRFFFGACGTISIQHVSTFNLQAEQGQALSSGMSLVEVAAATSTLLSCRTTLNLQWSSQAEEGCALPGGMSLVKPAADTT